MAEIRCSNLVIKITQIEIDVDPAYQALWIVFTGAANPLDDVMPGFFATLAAGSPKQDVAIKIERDINVKCRVSKNIAIHRPIVWRRLNPRIRLTGSRDNLFQVKSAEISF